MGQKSSQRDDKSHFKHFNQQMLAIIHKGLRLKKTPPRKGLKFPRGGEGFL